MTRPVGFQFAQVSNVKKFQGVISANDLRLAFGIPMNATIVIEEISEFEGVLVDLDKHAISVYWEETSR